MILDKNTFPKGSRVKSNKVPDNTGTVIVYRYNYFFPNQSLIDINFDSGEKITCFARDFEIV